ncbi:creatininase family protein [Candidatus Bathyarchaeota archaeon]|nr:creatininase family protein [Candidatus Bathyarchaeota archaeon]
MVSDSVWLENLTWMEAEEAFNLYEVVVIPLGARTKEYGPHLPLNNDWIMAEYLTERVASEVPVIIMPTLQYGYYPSFTEYPGSVTLNLETFRDVVAEICLSLSNYGMKKFYVLNTGISTLRGLEPAREELEKHGVALRYTDLLKVDETLPPILAQEGGTHADESETSMMLYIKPEIVDMAKAVKDYHPLDGRGLTRDPQNLEAGAFSATGTYGDPTLATREKGMVIVEATVREIVREIKELIKQ